MIASSGRHRSDRCAFRTKSMLYRSLAGALVATCAFAAQPAQADWQFTKWGMTPDQVLAAGQGTVATKRLDQAQGENSSCYLQMSNPYTLGEIIFTKAEFCFDGAQ